MFFVQTLESDLRFVVLKSSKAKIGEEAECT